MVAIVNEGVGVGPNSAARSASSTSRRESINIAMFWGGRHYGQPLIIADWTCSYISGSELVRKRCLPGFFWPGKKILLSPPLLIGSQDCLVSVES